MLYGLGNMITTSIDVVADAYEKDSFDYEEIRHVTDEIEALDVVGKFIMAGGAAALGISYLMFTRVPRVGKLAGVVTAITGVAAGVLGYDLQKSAQNIQDYFESDDFKKGKEKKIEKEALKKKLITLAVQGNLTKGHLVKYLLENKKG